MRLRRGIAIAAVADGGVTMMLMGLVTNAVLEQSRWPSWRGWLLLMRSRSQRPTP
jgi:hypothetical protein